jgi:hypothetical protein
MMLSFVVGRDGCLCPLAKHIWRSIVSLWWRAKIVRYHGCLILIHDRDVGGRALGSYEIVADSVEAAATFATRDITRPRTVIDAQDLIHLGHERGGKPSIDRHHLVEMAKCEIDFALECDF